MLGSCESLVGFLCTVVTGIALGFGFTIGSALCAAVGSLMQRKA